MRQEDIDNLNTRAGQAAAKAKLGYAVGKVRATFDATDGKAIGAHGLGVFIPNNAIVTRAYYKVHTTFTSSTDAGTIALHVESADDLKAAVAISNGANPYDAGLVEGVPQADDASTYVETTADREVTATVAVEALTAGKLDLFIEYDVHNDGNPDL